jgi:TolB-like protein/Tfp pilus assembly protein PilF
MDSIGSANARVSLPPRTAPIRFGGFTLDLDGRSLARANGEEVSLTHREFALLREFVRHPGRVLSRDYLLDALAGKRADPFDRSIDMLVGRLRRKIEADATRPSLIVAAPGEGYKFAAPILDAALQPTRATEALATPASASNPPGRPRLSIVVLPFANLGGDPEQEYFVDGVTESLTADLSHIVGAFVIGRNTAFTYKGKNVDLRQVGRELNVRYVLEGSVQRAGARMRISVQLIDAESGNQLWVERFDKPLADLLDMQDEIVARLANALDAQLIAAEARRAEGTPDSDSLDLCFRGKAWLNKGITPDVLSEARHLFERALELDPNNVAALVGIAGVDTTVAVRFVTGDRTARLANAEAALTRALSLAPEHALAHYCLGVVLIHTNRVARGIGECERALQLNRNLAVAHGHIGFAKYQLGRSEETEAHIRHALRLSPRDPSVHIWCMFAGTAKLYLGQDEEAIDWLRRSIEGNRNNPMSYFLLAAALANLGQIDEARSEARAGLAINPAFSISRILATASPDNPVAVAAWARFIASLRRVGVPEE